MKLMIVGSDRIYSIENFYVKYLREAGVEVNHFPAQRFFYDYYQQGILQKILYRLGISGILKSINLQFKKEVANFNPEVIWVFKGMELYPSSLRWAKNRGIKLVNFNGDSPFLFSGRGSGNSYVTDSISLYDLHLTYSVALKVEMESKYSIPTKILPFGYDIDNRLFDQCCNEEEIRRVCFVGNPDVHRGIFLQQLADRGVPLDLFGNNWQSFVKHPEVQIFEPVYADDCWRILRKYRVQLNLMRPHNPDSHNMRSFELGGIGAIQLAPATIDHETYFKPNKEIFTFHDIDDCERKAWQLLELNDNEAAAIRGSARLRSEKDGYSYKARSAEVSKFLNIVCGQV